MIRAWSWLRSLLLVMTLVWLAACAPLFGTESRGSILPPDIPANRQIVLAVDQSGPHSARPATIGPRYVQRSSYSIAPATNSLLNRIAREYGLERQAGWPIRSVGLYCEVFVVPAGVNRAQLLGPLRKDSRVTLAQPMNGFRTLSRSYDDPLMDLQTSLVSLDTLKAHERSTGKGVKVAVIDSGIDYAHPELRDKIAVFRNFIRAGGVSPRAEIHGTAVAGIIAAAARNQQGIVGVAPDVSISALRACRQPLAADPAAQCSTYSLAQALDAALEADVQVINLSLAGPADTLLTILLEEAVTRGVLVVTAADGASPGLWQDVAARGVNVFRVAAYPPRNADPSRDSDPFQLSAPGVEILTTTPSAGYGFLSGSSLAAAHVSGVLALLLEQVPHLPPQEAAAALSTAPGPGRASKVLNACHALSYVLRDQGCSLKIASQ